MIWRITNFTQANSFSGFMKKNYECIKWKILMTSVFWCHVSLKTFLFVFCQQCMLLNKTLILLRFFIKTPDWTEKLWKYSCFKAIFRFFFLLQKFSLHHHHEFPNTHLTLFCCNIKFGIALNSCFEWFTDCQSLATQSTRILQWSFLSLFPS